MLVVHPDQEPQAHGTEGHEDDLHAGPVSGAVDAALRAWVEETAGGRIAWVSRSPAGGSRELYFLDVERADGTVVPLVLRCEGGGSFAGTEISPSKEAVVYRALEPTNVPVPGVVGIAPGGAALLMER